MEFHLGLNYMYLFTGESTTTHRTTALERRAAEATRGVVGKGWCGCGGGGGGGGVVSVFVGLWWCVRVWGGGGGGVGGWGGECILPLFCQNIFPENAICLFKYDAHILMHLDYF